MTTNQAEEPKLNPRVQKMEIGKKYLRPVSILPLSAADQTSMVDLAVGVFLQFSEKANSEGVKDEDVPAIIIDLLEKNISKIIAYVIDEEEGITPDEFYKQVTNEQLIELVEIVWSTNFEVIRKNVPNLLERLKVIFPSSGSLPKSLKDIQDTVSKTSTKKAGKKEA